MVAYKNINGKTIKMTAEEEADLNLRKKTWEDGSFDRAIKYLREKRNKLLIETDYLGLSDNTMSEEMKTYRQELRDITEGLTTKEEVEAVEFPEKP